MSDHLTDTNVGNTEYIRKSDAIDDLHTQLMYRMGSDDMKRRLDDWVKTLPPADVVQVVHARWVNYSPVTIKCSQCGHVIHDWRYSECKYCPNCGAKMDAQGEE